MRDSYFLDHNYELVKDKKGSTPVDTCTQVLMVFVLLYLHLLKSPKLSSMFNAALDEDLSETPITLTPAFMI